MSNTNTTRTNNPLLHTDVYKVGHMDQYTPGTSYIYSHTVARSARTLPYTVFFGLQYYLKNYLMQPITEENVEEFLAFKRHILGTEGTETRSQLMRLSQLGYIPMRIRAVPEGTIMPVRNLLMTLESTHPEFPWVPGFFESLLLKVWNTTTVASYSHVLKEIIKLYSANTCDDDGMVPFQIHDFGYRGCSSEETAELSGAAHLVNFLGSDTIPAIKMLRDNYGAALDGPPIGLSVPASEHSVMCSYTYDGELDAFRRMLELYPSGIVSIVSDTYNLWRVLTEYADELYPSIMNREGKLVFRPDSGDPELIVCGDPDTEGPAKLGVIRLLDQKFGSTINSKGYRVLNPHVGAIYGDGMTRERIQSVLGRLADMGYASSNIVFGVGGLLLQQHSRDTQGFATKATFCRVNGEDRDLFKDPITDPGKKSLCGKLALYRDETGQYRTVEADDEEHCLLQPVYQDGKLLREQTLAEIRELASSSTTATSSE